MRLFELLDHYPWAEPQPAGNWVHLVDALSTREAGPIAPGLGRSANVAVRLGDVAA